ncbi:MAG TPA: Uma2 family endonuclease [Gemmatimonadales bacterium]
MPRSHHFTAAAVRAFPDDGNRYEVVHGELLVTSAPSVRHQTVLARLFHALNTYLVHHAVDGLRWSPADISYGDDTLVQPDLFVADLAAALHSGRWEDVRTLYLVIEALSPSTKAADRGVKRRLYQEQRIPEYWIVDGDHDEVEVWTAGAHFPRRERDRFTWRHPALTAECEVDLSGVFAR